MEKRRIIISKLSATYIVIILLANIIMPLGLVLGGKYLGESKGLLITLFVIVVIVINYLLVIRPIINIESVLYSSGGEAYTARQLKRLERGTGLERAFYNMYQEQRENVEREYRSEILKQEAQLMALQSQMNPHFLFNTLESIRGYAVMHKITEIARMTEALAKMSRRMTASSATMVSLKQEIQLVENYMTIQQFRFRDKFTLDIKVEDPELLTASVLNLLLQPIVENAVVHGAKVKRGTYRISIEAYQTEKRLIIRVKDNGCGIDRETLAGLNRKLEEKSPAFQAKATNEHIGIALPNINQRIKLYLGAEYGINIMSTEGVGTTVEVILPLTPHKEGIYET